MSDYRISGVPFQAQQLDNWCWAAVARAIGAVWSQDTRRQCEIVTERRGEENCAPGTARDGIDDLTEVLAQVMRIDIEFRNRNLLSQPDAAFSLLEATIRSNRPVAITMSWGSGANHYVCAYGVRSGNGASGFWIYDPARSWETRGNSRFATLAEMDAYPEKPDGAAGRQGRWIEAFWPRADGG